MLSETQDFPPPLYTMYVIKELGQFTFYKISGQYLHAIVKVHAYIYIFKSKELITPVKLK